MKRLAHAGVVFAVLLAVAPVVLAYTSPGTPVGYVNDFAGVLSAETKKALESELSSFERTTSNEITVVTVSDMGGDYVEHYAVKLFEEWGIGKKSKDNGVLLLLAISERKMRMEVGYGLEGALPDSVAQSILNNEMTPRLRAGDYDGAVTAGVQAIVAATKGEYSASRPASGQQGLNAASEDVVEGVLVVMVLFLQFFSAVLARSRSWWAGGIVGFSAGLFGGWYFVLGTLTASFLVGALTVLGLMMDYAVSKGYQNAKARGVRPPWWAGGSSGSGGRSGGFGGFGGGSSGGGGASGSW